VAGSARGESFDFTLGEYLPGRHYIVQSVWHNGSLLRAQPIEVLSYFAAGNNPSGTFSLSCTAKTVAAPSALEVTLKSRAGARATSIRGILCRTEGDRDGVPQLRRSRGPFPAGVTALLAVGKDNMIGAFASACIGQPVKIAEPHGSALEYYFVRDIDGIPGVFSEADLSEGYSRRCVALAGKMRLLA